MSLFSVILLHCTLQVLKVSSRSSDAKPPQNHDQKSFSDFRTIITTKKDMYIDKTLFIKEVIDHTKEAPILITRPLNFGKTLALSTLEYFFSNQEDQKLFTGLDIMKPDFDELRNHHMGKYSVIRVDFSDVRETSYQKSYAAIQDIISKEFARHKYITDAKTLLKPTFDAILKKTADEKQTADSISWLSRWVDSYHNQTKNVVVLIDGYDTPMYTSFEYNYYEEMKQFMKKFLRCSFKLNPNLKMAVISGMITVSGGVLLKNIKSYTIFDHEFSNFFGFTRDEVIRLIERTTKNEAIQHKKLEGIDAMFKAYLFGNSTMYNPKAVTSYLLENKAKKAIDSSSRTTLQDMLLDHGLYPILTIQQLLANEGITKEVSRDIDFPNKKDNEKDHWTFMLHAGFLTASTVSIGEYGNLSAVLCIPNLEMRTEISTILKNSRLKIPDYEEFTDDLVRGNFDDALVAMDRYLQDTGPIFKSLMQKFDQTRLADYIAQMLRGVELRYNTSIVREVHKASNWHPGVSCHWVPRSYVYEGYYAMGVDVNVTPKNNTGVPIRVWVVETTTMKILTHQMKTGLCPVVSDLDRNETRIVVFHSWWCVRTCLKPSSWEFQ